LKIKLDQVDSGQQSPKTDVSKTFQLDWKGAMSTYLDIFGDAIIGIVYAIQEHTSGIHFMCIT